MNWKGKVVYAFECLAYGWFVVSLVFFYLTGIHLMFYPQVWLFLILVVGVVGFIIRLIDEFQKRLFKSKDF